MESLLVWINWFTWDQYMFELVVLYFTRNWKLLLFPSSIQHHLFVVFFTLLFEKNVDTYFFFFFWSWGANSRIFLFQRIQSVTTSMYSVISSFWLLSTSPHLTDHGKLFCKEISTFNTHRDLRKVCGWGEKFCPCKNI